VLQWFPDHLLEMRRLLERLKKDLTVSTGYFQVPGRVLQASDLWRRMLLSTEGLEDLDRVTKLVVGTNPTAVVADGFSNLLAVVHLLKHTHVQDAARRGRRELDGAKLLDGHPEEEIDAAFLAARLDHMALPYSKTWLRLLFS
jgi:hypothetical protein